MSYRRIVNSPILNRTAEKLKEGLTKVMAMDQVSWQKELPLVQLNKAEDLDRWVVGSDQDIGGFSSARLDVTPEGTGVFHGTLSQQVPTDNKIVTSGYAAVRTKKLQPTLFGESFWDIQPFRYLALRVRGDHRKYLVNLRTSSFIKTDLYQHRLFLRTPGQWETVYIPFQFFAMTNNGSFISQHVDMDREEVENVGLSISDRQDGPFRLELDWIKAVNTENTEGEFDKVNYGRYQVQWQ
ncbi:hypothetical protein IWQ60_005795 [Tieghemiomyces parasiticus]|uniref:NADH:ubiquinone oxidoreductase intermediate-associated protein 30 domain-containing protein n=1 Tax=Tieghemiomyces parasiticus TaxID=78921 RepID=A0A9W8DYJ8_9FUNG|nr:hypothetical protein IWQ60_005795 [Tieghemiomyces parasiticus]